jgi:predicted transcriptional regulator of viral defense system
MTADASAMTLLRDRFDGRPFRVAEAIEAGVSRDTLSWLRKSGRLAAAGRGVLRFPDAGIGTLSDLAIVSTRVPAGTICLNSALSFWDLSDEIPDRVHIAVPRRTRRPAISEPATTIHVFNPRTFDLGRQEARTDADEPFWIYSPERSIADAMRMSRWVGRDVALHALQRYVRRSGSEPARVAEIARQLGASTRIQSALETLLS